MKGQVYLFLDNIRSVHNVGSIFRTAEGAGISKIICAGTTPTPLDRFGRKRKDFAKVALGSEDMLPWEFYDDPLKALKKFKKEDFKIIVVEQNDKAIDYKKVEIEGDTIIVVGNEVEGVNSDLIKLADVVVDIPMKGKKESLNVSVATGIMMYRLLDK